MNFSISIDAVTSHMIASWVAPMTMGHGYGIHSFDITTHIEEVVRRVLSADAATEIERLRALSDGNGERAQSYFEELERLRAAVEDAVDTLEAMDLHTNNPLYDRLRATLEQPTPVQVPGGPTCHPGAFWEASSPTTGGSLAVCSICKQPARI